METKKAKVIMLPTKDASHICKSIIGLHFTEKMISKVEMFTNQHLYITTDDEIKEGDWFISSKTNKPLQFFHDISTFKEDRKIIATTDKSLRIRMTGCTIETKPLPQPSQAFIKAFVKAGGIDEVLVEYEIHNHPDLGEVDCTLKVDSHNTITIHPIKDSWNREEVEHLISLSNWQINMGRNKNLAQSDIDNWIKDNL